MALVVQTPSRFGNLVTEMEDEEDLFEIDLEAVNSIPPPKYYWGSYCANTTGTALLANCLLPAADISSAVPASASVTSVMNASGQPVSGRQGSLPVPEPVPLGKLLQLPYSSVLAYYSRK
ncbi:uncharacterized protein LOC116208775 [Punica granatum]|uniref:Uncharacterized protein n=2 Tax=Punica granatum TaxID=22663 RepID=A0A218XDW5_PUNGR|nr:uncharacterized protein LOC116208775 [Punica granatum]OWM82522.1 hypothetical protein CDL15_Pgr002097 [Punica granatum]PKI38529.1 hypothetical protein CRG98_041094 [Punica granatum]